MKRLVLSVLLFTLTVQAEDTIGWHEVKQGETLSRITSKYLGSSAAWRDNWRLNPDIKDPNRLKPGQRIRIILSRTLPTRSALVNRVARHVEKKPEPAPWTQARAGDQLAERNGIRTFEASSAELKFEDNTLLTLTERSLVFLRGAKKVDKNREASEIEIVDGHADLDKPTQTAARAQDIEIIVGTTTAKPAAGESKARFRKEGASAQVMSYRGGTSVTSAGASVRVSEGMGVAVPEGKKPPKPERLLAAPAAQAVETVVDQPVLRWSAVEGAASYTAEVCRDASCAEIVARTTMLDATEWKSPAIEPGEYVWRVSARSASGLDGFATVSPLRVRRAVVDVTTANDSGLGSLRDAIERANEARSAFEIRIRVSGTIGLTSPLPRIVAPMAIIGNESSLPIGSVTTVGLAHTTLLNPNRSEVTIDFGGAAVGLDATESLTLRNLVLVGAGIHVAASGALSMENVVIGTLLARTDTVGIEVRAVANLRRVLITGMLKAGIVGGPSSTIGGEHVEVSNSGFGIISGSPAARLRNSLLLLNETGAALVEGGAIEQSTFRGNRIARALPTRLVADMENVFDDNFLTAVIAGRVTNIRVADDGTTVVTGTATPGADVEIYTSATVPARVTAGSDGAFEVQLEKEGKGT